MPATVRGAEMPGDSGGDEPKLRSATAARRRLLLMLGVAEFQHAWRRLSPFWHWLSAIALAMAGSALIEESKWLDSFEDAVVREVARQRSLQDDLKAPGPGELQIQHLEISARARVAQLEQRTDVADVIERLGGVAPVDRGQMAKVIQSLAQRLPEPVAPAARPIVAIDVDLAPLERTGTTDEQRRDVLRALRALREKAHVIAVVLPRAAGPAGGRDKRNCFMRQAACTRLAGSAAERPGADAQCPIPHPEVPPDVRGALFFASPRLFHQTASYPTKYPYRLSKEADLSAEGAGSLPPYFPSLGTLIREQHKHAFPHHGESAGAASATAGLDATALRQTLTFLCEEAHSPQGDGELLEDRMSSPSASGIAKSYDEQRYSWRLLDDPRLQQTVINDIESIDKPEQLGAVALNRPVLLLGIDGGAAYDKFGIAGISAQSISGAGLHALQALSIEWQPNALVQKFAGIAVDVVVAAAYSLTWLLLYRRLLRPLRSRMPIIGGWLVAGVPLGLGIGLTWLCFELVAIGMSIDLWINPIYIVAGLLLGIYVDAWNDSEPGTEEERKLRSRLLGLPAAREALRSGFGQRVEGLRFAATSGYQPVTGMDELRVQAEVVRSRLGVAALTDAVLSALLRLVVLVGGWACILAEAWRVWRS